MPFTSPVFDAIACGMLLASMNYESFIIRRAKMQPSHFVAKAPTAKNNVFVANRNKANTRSEERHSNHPTQEALQDQSVPLPPRSWVFITARVAAPSNWVTLTYTVTVEWIRVHYQTRSITFVPSQITKRHKKIDTVLFWKSSNKQRKNPSKHWVNFPNELLFLLRGRHLFLVDGNSAYTKRLDQGGMSVFELFCIYKPKSSSIKHALQIRSRFQQFILSSFTDTYNQVVAHTPTAPEILYKTYWRRRWIRALLDRTHLQHSRQKRQQVRKNIFLRSILPSGQKTLTVTKLLARQATVFNDIKVLLDSLLPQTPIMDSGEGF